MSKVFADKLQSSIEKSNSCIIAGFDPAIEHFPEFLIAKAHKASNTNAEAIRWILCRFYELALDEISKVVAGVKPNIAFFEQYGIPGLQAFVDICRDVNKRGLPLIADAKRGDIGSTAKAYSNAFLGKSSAFGEVCGLIEADALTVNPFLGFDTIEVFLEDCLAYGKGLFVLVKTSNPGSSVLQDLKGAEGISVSETIAEWIAQKSSRLIGKCGYSGLGAVVGATYPQEAQALRKRMPDSFFLIPGMGAQGGSAEDSIAGFAKHSDKKKPGGGTINISRGIFHDLPKELKTAEELRAVIGTRVSSFNRQINAALK